MSSIKSHQRKPSSFPTPFLGCENSIKHINQIIRPLHHLHPPPQHLILPKTIPISIQLNQLLNKTPVPVILHNISICPKSNHRPRNREVKEILTLLLLAHNPWNRTTPLHTPDSLPHLSLISTSCTSLKYNAVLCKKASHSSIVEEQFCSCDTH